MIVKNEAHVLPRTLPMLCQHFKISYWVISDTGSTDGTQDLIRAFFKERGIPGELVETSWKNFGYNRSIAFEAAYNKSDYVLVWDADDMIVGNFALPSTLQGDAYEFEFGDASGFRYSRLQLFNNRKRWKYVGVLHEYPAPLEKLGPVTHVTGDYYFVSGREGARNKDPDKYKKDAAVLEDGLLEEPDNTRHMFYCANSYMNANDHDNAIRMYKKTLDANGWVEEKYISCLHLFECGRHKGCPEQYLHYLVESSRYSPLRVEAIAQLARYYCVKDMHAVACAYYTLVKDIYEKGYSPAQISKFLFAKKQEFDYYLPYYLIIAGTKAGNHQLAAQMFAHICKLQYAADAWHTRNVFHNMRFIEGLQPSLDLLFSILEYRSLLPTDGFESVQNTNIATYIESCMPLLTADMKPLGLRPSAKKPRVLLTMPCTTMERFTQAMNAIQRTWSDLSTVDAFYCQRGKVTVQQAKKLREQYPFMEFGTDDVEVYAKKSGAMYWIHLDDAAVFVRRDAYVKRSVEAIEKQGVQQVLYNRNYALTYTDWNINGAGKEAGPGLLLHEIKHDLPSPSCGSWPHFAMRPGCTLISAMKAPASQSRFVDDNWKTCYFNTISHVLRPSETQVNECTLGPDQIQFYTRTVDTNMFVVNLERRPDRRAEIEKKLQGAGVKSYACVRAVDGKELVATSELATMFQKNDFGNRRGVIGCALSHYRLWQRLLTDKKHTHYVILEDDVELCDGFTGKLASLTIPANADLLMLGFSTWNGDSRLSGNGSVEPLNPEEYAGGTFGYIVTKRGAEKLCAAIKSEGCTRAIDWFMVRRDRCDSVCYKVQPQLVLTEWVQNYNSSVDSDIQRDRNVLDLSAITPAIQQGGIRWRFIPGMDSFGNDMACIGRKDIQELLSVATRTDGCVAVNTLGYLKHKVEPNLIKPACFGPDDGMFIRE